MSSTPVTQSVQSSVSCVKCSATVVLEVDRPDVGPLTVPDSTTPSIGEIPAESSSHVIRLADGSVIDVMCEKCMDSVLDELKDQIADANNDLSKYTEALFELERERRTGRLIEHEIDQSTSLLHTREVQLQAELEDLRAKETDYMQQLQLLQQEEESVSEQEQKLRAEIVQLNRAVIDSEESMASVDRKLQYCSSSLRRLKKFNLVNEAFFIQIPSSPSQPASINGLRLGRTPEYPIAWSEINAAWGFLCLLADVLVKKYNVNLAHYRLLPRGSYSVIIKKSDRSALELFCEESAGSTGGITRFLTSRKFDGAVHAFVQIVGELVIQIRKSNPEYQPPHKIDEREGKVGNESATLQFNSEDNWTRAMKNLLAVLKSIIDLS
jgi:beclin